MKKRCSAVFLLLVFLVCTAGTCTLANDGDVKSQDNEYLSILLWNVHNLFDAVDDGTEYPEFTNAGGWNSQKYSARLLSLSDAIEASFNLGPGGKSPPALIGLTEVENLRVLEDLAGGSLAKYGYNWLGFGHVPGSALGIGALSRFPLKETRVHSITTDGQTAPRPVLEFFMEAEGGDIIIFLNHWKSKVGGDQATEPLRRASARVINRRVAEIRSEESDVPVIVMGDLNLNIDEFYKQTGAYVCALMPDDPWAANLAAAENLWDFLLLCTNKPPASKFFDSSILTFYTPWGNELDDGSYYYRNNWETIDHFLLCAELFSGTGWDYYTSMLLNFPPFTNAAGYPMPYSPRTGLGLSDHLPLMLFLKYFESTEAR